MADDKFEKLRQAARSGTPDKFSKLQQALAAQGAEQPGLGQRAWNIANEFSEGAVRSVGDMVAAVPELTAAGMRAVGLPAPERGAYQGAIQGGITSVGRATPAALDAVAGEGAYAQARGPVDPNSMESRIARGAGEAFGDAASFYVPALTASKLARAGSITQQAGRAMAQQPAMQATAAAAGGAVGEATDNPALGLATSLAVPVAATAGRRAITPVASQLSPEEARLAGVLESSGVRLTPGQKTGSPALRKVEQLLGQLPFSGPRQQKLYEAQRAALNRAVLGKAGIDADAATPEVIQRAYDDIGSVFDDLVRQTRIVIDDQFADDVAAAAEQYGRRLTADQAPVFQSYMDDIARMIEASRQQGQTAFVEGDQYQNIASSLLRRIRSSRNNPDLQEALRGLAGALDGAMDRSVSDDLAPVWKEARRQYRNLKIIDDAISRAPAADAVTGDIPLSGLKNAVKASDRSGYARGRGEMADLSRAGTFLQSASPRDSGTPAGNFFNNVLTGGGITGGMYLADPMAGAAAATTLGGPPLVQALMNSGPGRAYLTNQIAPASQPLREAMARILASQGPGQLEETR